METSKIRALLNQRDSTPQENLQSQDVREVAKILLSSITGVEQLLHDLLSRVVRPLFSKQQHPNLTATGRKKLVPDAPIASRLSNTIDWDDELKIWKNGWTSDLLGFILLQYRALPSDQERSVFESQFHLLIPPILNLIDDGDISYKRQGCALLGLLCGEVTHCQSDILKRTGLSDVFSDALRTNFMHLPTLTPEEESLTLLAELYPAFRALVDARFLSNRQNEANDNKEAATLTLNLAESASSVTKSTKPTILTINTSSTSVTVLDSKEEDARQSILDLILRHGILASYAHAIDYVHITSFLLHEASIIIVMMGIYSAKYLQTVLPLLRNVLCNPFATAHVPLLISALECMEALTKTCWPRIREKWWGECLRGIVGCWMQVEDDEGRQQTQNLLEVKLKLRELGSLLERIVGEDFGIARKRLVSADQKLKDLFDTRGTNTMALQGLS